jgi:tetratricopeptide (TPR) repeat protein
MNAASERFKAALSALSRGDVSAARTAGEAALRAQPHNPTILQLLGVISCQAGNPRQGADYLRKAIARGGDTPDNRFNLAKALLEVGELDEAERLCSKGQGSSREAQRLLADIHKAQGRHDDVVWLYQALVDAEPYDVESWNNLGNARHQIGDLDGALEALHRARSLKPDAPLVHINLARVLQSLDRHQEACLMLEKAALLSPKDPAPLLELGRLLTSIDHPAAALKALGTAARLDSTDSRIFAAIGVAFTDLSDLKQAERAFRFALKADPHSAVNYLNLGLLLEKANRLDDFHALIDQAASNQVAGDEIDYLRALSLSRRGETEQALDVVRTVRSGALSQATVFHFEGQLADKLGRVEEAFTAFDEMNRAAASSPLGVGVDRSAYSRAIANLTERTTTDWFDSWREATVTPEPPSPAFLVGFPRSGTTLLDTMLMGHSSTHVLEELPIIEELSKAVGDFDRIAALDASEVAFLRSRYFAELEKLSPPPPGALVIDKNPLSMIRMPLIHRLFPDARIILALRHPCDVVLSCWMQNFKVTEAMSSFLDLPNSSRAYAEIFAYWEKCREVLPLNVHTIRYEDLVLEVQAELKPLMEFLGVPWEENVLDHQRAATARGYIRTPSYAQVTEGIYARASGRWTRYREYLEPVVPTLTPWAEKFGYSLD